MEFEEIRDYLLSLPTAVEDFPFGPHNAVFKVAGKMFALLSFSEEGLISINLKNAPDKNIELRERFSAITPGYHMNKAHWNTLQIDGTLSAQLIKSLISESYQCVVSGLPKSKQKEIQRNY